MSEVKRYLFLLLFVVFSVEGFSQASSPYSTFGIGEQYGNELIQNQGMGGTGVSQPQFWSLNNQNPALLVFNQFTIFQAGAAIESKTLAGDTISQKSTNGNLNYLVTAFPVKPGKWTTSFGLMPLTRVNYKLSYTEPIANNDTLFASVLKQGKGGLSQFYWSNGIRVHENFSVGLKAAYIFGSAITDYSNYVPVESSGSPFIPFTASIKEQVYVRDFKFGLGFSFSKDSIGRGDYRISLGAVYNFSTDLNADKTSTIERRLTSGTPVTSDTVTHYGGSVTIPSSLVIGASISKGAKWSVATEFSFQDWTKYRNINNEAENLEKAWRVSVGGEITPDQLAVRNYLKRITYRIGFNYEKTPILVEVEPQKNEQLTDLGINFGFSLPTGRSSIDWAFKMGKRGNKSEGILEETYYKVYFGITFNDLWFIKRKFD